MNSGTSHFKIGLFVLTSALLVLAGLFWIGAVEYYQDTREYVTFFDTSVEGMSPGSKVKYRGLEVGRVTDIGLAPDGELVRVAMELRSDFRVDETRAAQLKLKGITGACYLALVQAPENLKEVTPELGFKVDRSLIPSIPGQMQQVTRALRNAYSDVQSLELEELSREYRRVAANANSFLGSDALNSSLREIDSLSGELSSLAARLNRNQPAKRWSNTMRDISRAAASADQTLSSLQRRIDALPPQALAEISRSTRDTLQGIQKTNNSTRLQLRTTLVQFRQSVRQLHRTLAEVRGLARELRRDPGKVLSSPREEGDPFGR